VVSQILDDEDRQNIEAALARADALKTEIVRAKSAGIDVTQAERDLEEATTKMRAVKASYFPSS
tara:strand:+ start:1385 stop:1576 length:192 start_codon:yes stop_codon:yes gene_type:complete